LVNGCEDVRVVTVAGEVERVAPIATTDDQLIEMIQTLARRGGHMEREWTPNRPILDLQLADGSRLAAAAWVTARPYIAVRRHALVDADQRDLVRMGMYDDEVRSLLGALVRSRRNVLISGGQGVGKTTLLRALLHECRPDERIIVLEQEPELHLDRMGGRHDHVLLFMERLANAEGQGQVTLADLGRAVKRFTPERIVVGEVRGPEVIDMCEALTQGIAGGLATIHAESSLGVFPRLPVYARLAGGQWSTQDVLELAALALDAIVHLRRDRDGHRVVSEIRSVSQFDPVAHQVVTDPWYVTGADGRAVRNPSAPIPVDVMADLEDHGFRPSPMLVGAGG
jgi:Flp pilus assembly CpaF family ATPase